MKTRNVVEENSRRQFLKTGTQVASGLVIGFYLPERKGAFGMQAMEQSAVFAPNAFLRIGADNIVTVISKHIEVGQVSTRVWQRLLRKSSTPLGHRCGLRQRRPTTISIRTCGLGCRRPAAA